MHALLGQSGYTVRAVTRDPTAAKAVALKEKGCEVVQASLDDGDAIRNAIKGSYGVFLVTNYWQDLTSRGKSIKESEQQTSAKRRG